MSISDEKRQLVRKRAEFACEYCGITEQDTGGELTLDHFKPQAAGGEDKTENLVYACFRCNLYKGDYWSEEKDAPKIFNPRLQSAEDHFWFSPNGLIYAVTEIGEFTIGRLRLNRKPLVAYRRKMHQQITDREFYEQTQNVNRLLAETNEQQSRLLQQQQKMLEEQQKLLKLLLKNN